MQKMRIKIRIDAIAPLIIMIIGFLLAPLETFIALAILGLIGIVVIEMRNKK